MTHNHPLERIGEQPVIMKPTLSFETDLPNRLAVHVPRIALSLKR